MSALSEHAQATRHRRRYVRGGSRRDRVRSAQSAIDPVATSVRGRDRPAVRLQTSPTDRSSGGLRFQEIAEIRGIGASAATGRSMSAREGFQKAGGELLEFSLYRREVVYDRGYQFGIDSFDISHDGRLNLVPRPARTRQAIRGMSSPRGPAASRSGTIAAGGLRSHDTVVGASWRACVSRRCVRPLPVRSERRPAVEGLEIGRIQRAGLVRGVAGVRPFTIDAGDALAFHNRQSVPLGFQVSDVATGSVLYTVHVPGFSVPRTFRGLAVSWDRTLP